MKHNNNFERKEAIRKLQFFLENPGYFSILLTGENGTGKQFTLETILKEKQIGFYYPFQIGGNVETIKKIFEKDYIVIKNTEELNELQQNILFEALSTNDGSIGIEPNRGLKRIIFTSSFDIESLKESQKLSNYFWGRISQLAVHFPSFKDNKRNIYNDFNSVWEKMNFENYNKCPNNSEFEYWLRENCGTFSGNFRDLDKIAILWHQYRIIEYHNQNQDYKSDIEARIFPKVRADFESFTRFPTTKPDNTNLFEFEKGKSWEQIERNFKSKFKTWAKKEYGTIKNATQELNMPYRKMDKW